MFSLSMFCSLDISIIIREEGFWNPKCVCLIKIRVAQNCSHKQPTAQIILYSSILPLLSPTLTKISPFTHFLSHELSLYSPSLPQTNAPSLSLSLSSPTHRGTLHSPLLSTFSFLGFLSKVGAFFLHINFFFLHIDGDDRVNLLLSVFLATLPVESATGDGDDRRSTGALVLLLLCICTSLPVAGTITRTDPVAGTTTRTVNCDSLWYIYCSVLLSLSGPCSPI